MCTDVQLRSHELLLVKGSPRSFISRRPLEAEILPFALMRHRSVHSTLSASIYPPPTPPEAFCFKTTNMSLYFPTPLALIKEFSKVLK